MALNRPFFVWWDGAPTGMPSMVSDAVKAGRCIGIANTFWILFGDYQEQVIADELFYPGRRIFVAEINDGFAGYMLSADWGWMRGVAQMVPYHSAKNSPPRQRESTERAEINRLMVKLDKARAELQNAANLAADALKNKDALAEAERRLTDSAARLDASRKKVKTLEELMKKSREASKSKVPYAYSRYASSDRSVRPVVSRIPLTREDVLSRNAHAPDSLQALMSKEDRDRLELEFESQDGVR